MKLDEFIESDEFMSAAAYRVSDHGRRALESKDPSIPSDYRTILWVIEFQGFDHLSRIQLLDKRVLADCLAEMDELRLIERVHASDGETGSSSAVTSRTPAPVYAVTADDSVIARTSLSEHGAYLSEQRLKNRPALAKAPSDTTILIVEDDPDQLALADLRVSMAGYGVRVARSQAALLLSLARDGTPDLVLLDVQLPDGDGFEILSKLRRLRSFESLPIVMLTAKTDPEDIVKGLRLGADGYITKPYSKNILADAIRRIFGQVKK